jgi:hypothetical protein
MKSTSFIVSIPAAWVISSKLLTLQEFMKGFWGIKRLEGVASVCMDWRMLMSLSTRRILILALHGIRTRKQYLRNANPCNALMPPLLPPKRILPPLNPHQSLKLLILQTNTNIHIPLPRQRHHIAQPPRIRQLRSSYKIWLAQGPKLRLIQFLRHKTRNHQICFRIHLRSIVECGFIRRSLQSVEKGSGLSVKIVIHQVVPKFFSHVGVRGPFCCGEEIQYLDIQEVSFPII